MNQITNSDDVIDSRDVIARIEELQAERDDYELDEHNGITESEIDAARLQAWEEENQDESEELSALEALREAAEPYGEDWNYGALLINEDYFTEYCEDLLKDCGMIPKDIPSFIEIDWDATAENMKADYTEIDFNGETYLVR